MDHERIIRICICSFIAFQYLIKALNCFQLSVSLDAAIYRSYAGDSVTLNCTGTGSLNENDLVWQMFPKEKPDLKKVIYFNEIIKTSDDETNNRYYVNFTGITNSSLCSQLSIYNVSEIDEEYIYECACNIYTACSIGEKISAQARLVVEKKSIFLPHVTNITDNQSTINARILDENESDNEKNSRTRRLNACSTLKAEYISIQASIGISILIILVFCFLFDTENSSSMSSSSLSKQSSNIKTLAIVLSCFFNASVCILLWLKLYDKTSDYSELIFLSQELALQQANFIIAIISVANYVKQSIKFIQLIFLFLDCQIISVFVFLQLLLKLECRLDALNIKSSTDKIDLNRYIVVSIVSIELFLLFKVVWFAYSNHRTQNRLNKVAHK